ncbi:hypothetical protein F4821DRAFT_258496 [Hypoxylon rubiginosum]|uniref:Uncharacterized protein n=1 Tax=Hypoxylon rubiginosum TaxID=110542 RepID=A0ACC0D5K8_9PEZI|nr:hypothetical protein F4821DRAFT_258496 [Hypoxylon rubiginosum]
MLDPKRHPWEANNFSKEVIPGSRPYRTIPRAEELEPLFEAWAKAQASSPPQERWEGGRQSTPAGGSTPMVTLVVSIIDPLGTPRYWPPAPFERSHPGVDWPFFGGEVVRTSPPSHGERRVLTMILYDSSSTGPLTVDEQPFQSEEKGSFLSASTDSSEQEDAE